MGAMAFNTLRALTGRLTNARSRRNIVTSSTHPVDVDWRWTRAAGPVFFVFNRIEFLEITGSEPRQRCDGEATNVPHQPQELTVIG